jgi:hypothetical protein
MFQVESRAQMSCLPRLRPEKFYDIVVQVAIIRPGPIVGNMVHPFLKRRQGRAAVVYPHPSLEPVLKRTLGVPLFQEQLLKMAMICAGFSGGEAEELRRAFGFKRSEARMKEVEVKLRRGMASNGITGKAQDEIVQSITSFALYGFPESHAASFALIAYASAYLKCNYLAAFTAAILNNQPMGFYQPFTIIKDAQRHGLRVRPIDVTRSDWLCTIEDMSPHPPVPASPCPGVPASPDPQLTLKIHPGRHLGKLPDFGPLDPAIAVFSSAQLVEQQLAKPATLTPQHKLLCVRFCRLKEAELRIGDNPDAFERHQRSHHVGKVCRKAERILVDYFG